MMTSINFQIGLIALLVTIRIDRQYRGSLRFGGAALIVALLYWMLPVRTFMYASVALCILFIVESFWGRVNSLPLLVLVLMSPIFEYGAAVFSFPVRLALSRYV